MLAIHRLFASSPLESRAIDAFLGAHGSPLVEGTSVTFLYRGEASALRLQHFLYGLPSLEPFVRVEGTDLWYLVLELPRASRLEYRLEVSREGKVETILDPLNPRRALDPGGENSVCHGAGYRAPTWYEPDPRARGGSIKTVDVPSEAFGETRSVRVYVPARFRPTRRYPLLVVHDGAEFLHYAELAGALDNLIHRHEIPAMIVALTEAERRDEEYAGDRRHASFVARELLPRLAEEFPLVGDARSRGLLGANLGAVAALSVAWRHPGVFGNLMLLSGAFAFTEAAAHPGGARHDPVMRFMARFRADPGNPAERAYISCGIYDSLIHENRSLVLQLGEMGLNLRFSEVRDGHNWEMWRGRLREGLSWLFPGPLWMVYP